MIPKTPDVSTQLKVLEQITAEFAEYCRTPGHPLMHSLMIAASMTGDPSATSAIANRLKFQLLGTPNANAADQLWLYTMLDRLDTDRSASVAVSGSGGRKAGGPRNISKALTTALSVFGVILQGNAKSMEEAWSLVAESEHLDSSTVKKYWMKWKRVLSEMLAQEGGFGGSVEGLNDLLKAKMAQNKEL